MSAKKIRLGEVSVGFTQSIRLALAHLTIDDRELFTRFGLTEKKLSSAHGRLSIARYMRLGHAATVLSQRQDFGLLMGRFTSTNFLGLAGLCIAQAPNVRTAAWLFQELEPLYAQNYRGQSCFKLEANQGAWLSFYSISPYNDFNRFVVESVLKGWCTQLSELCQESIKPERVEIEYAPPSYYAAYANFLHCQPHFNAKENRIFLSNEQLALSNPRFCSSTFEAIKSLCFSQLEQLKQTFTWRERITHLLATALKNGEPTLEQIASLVKLPAWTLRRKLEAEGVQFRQLINQVRYSLASTYISDTELSFSEIAWLLGFSSPEAFQRAFKRWSNLTPGCYRKQAIDQYNQNLT
ncbi:AraC family transcriptional regulator [Pseudomonas sp. F1_0610]|uniref:AraC family transcriptional regulator n=1 Tax=Pseudomonas sp. F1_0610 TaxID=3114284 RepID=UPI0039C0A954